MVYGNTPRALGKATIVGSALTIVVFVIFMVAAWVKGGVSAIPTAFRWPVVAVPFLVGGIVPAFVLPTTLFNISVEDGTIRHLFLNRYILAEHPIDDLEAIDLGRGLFAVVLHFRDGARIRFLGAHIAECHRLADDLTRMAEQEIEVRRGRGF